MGPWCADCTHQCDCCPYYNCPAVVHGAEPIDGSPVDAAPPAPAVRSLVNVSEKHLDMITGDLPGIDLERATRGEIIDAYALIGVPVDAATFYLGLLDGTPGS